MFIFFDVEWRHVLFFFHFSAFSVKPKFLIALSATTCLNEIYTFIIASYRYPYPAWQKDLWDKYSDMKIYYSGYIKLNTLRNSGSWNVNNVISWVEEDKLFVLRNYSMQCIESVCDFNFSEFCSIFYGKWSIP